jgi:hypothetical protein
MSAPKATDKQFIDLWNKHKSATKVAEIIGVTVRNASARRRRLEEKHGVKLTGKGAYPAKAQNKARHQLGVVDGVVIVFSDAHFWPGIRTTALKGLLWAIKEFKPVAVVCNGDAFDGASISRHARISWQQTPSVKEELMACTEALKEIEDAAKEAYYPVQLVWPLGNHDARLESRLSLVAPEFEGVAGFTLKDHFPAWHPCWSCWIGESVVIKHRFKGGVHATHNNTQASGMSTITGHLHSLKVTPYDDYRGTRWGVDTGCLADTNGPQFVDYLEDSPVNWRSGFAVLTIKDGEMLWPELVRKHSENFIDFRGQLIDVSEF